MKLCAHTIHLVLSLDKLLICPPNNPSSWHEWQICTRKICTIRTTVGYVNLCCYIVQLCWIYYCCCLWRLVRTTKLVRFAFDFNISCKSEYLCAGISWALQTCIFKKSIFPDTFGKKFHRNVQL